MIDLTKTPLDPLTLARRARVAIAVGCAFAALFLYSALSVVPSTAAGKPLGAHALNTLLPEGWSFFTRSPRGARQTVWLLHDGRWVTEPFGVNSAPGDVFGAGRTVRARNVELGKLYEQGDAAGGHWKTCPDSDVATCLVDAPAGVHAVNRGPDPTLCGDVAIAEQKPLPWAWARQFSVHVMPVRVLRLEVSCS